MLKSTYSNFKEYISIQLDKKPLQTIIIIALVTRLVAAIFSQGYGMHDDHFIAIEEPWSWTQGEDYDGWLPGTKGADSEPSIYSFFYPGINYILFEGMHAVGIDNPKFKMLIIRLLLGLFSLLTVFYGYKITKHYSSDKDAKQVGILLAILWFIPFFFGVRNLVEVIAIPALLGSTWMILKSNYMEKKDSQLLGIFFWAGLIAGLSISIRFQTIIYWGGMGLALLFQKKILKTIVFGLGGLISFAIIQGGLDYLVWEKPFAVLKGYIDYNLAHSSEYGNQDNILMYVTLIPGYLLPPIGALLFFGFFLKVKKHLIVFLPSFLFLAFHTYFPNRQERFIFTIIPMVVILGVIGWNAFHCRSVWWSKHQRLYKGFYRFFWIVNTILLVGTTLSYSKKSRCEAMHYFWKSKKEVNSIIIDDTGRRETMMMPVFYAGKAFNTLTISDWDATDTSINHDWSYIQVSHSRETLRDKEKVDDPQYVIFVEDIELEKRIEIMKGYYPELEFESYIEPSLADKIMKKLNPNNKNEDFYIYRTNI
jgi:hypothetical protein